jgi:hypothetical protein
LYDWYARNEALMACVLRDAGHHALTSEIAAMRFGPTFEAYRQVLAEGLTSPQRALLAVAMDFHAWRALAREGGLSPSAAAELFSSAVATLPTRPRGD